MRKTHTSKANLSTNLASVDKTVFITLPEDSLTPAGEKNNLNLTQNLPVVGQLLFPPYCFRTPSMETPI